MKTQAKFAPDIPEIPDDAIEFAKDYWGWDMCWAVARLQVWFRYYDAFQRMGWGRKLLTDKGKLNGFENKYC